MVIRPGWRQKATPYAQVPSVECIGFVDRHLLQLLLSSKRNGCSMPKLAFRKHLPKPDDPELVSVFADAIARGLPVTVASTAAGIALGGAAWYARSRRPAS